MSNHAFLPRFKALYLDQHTIEYDQETGALLIHSNGCHDCFSQQEAQTFYQWLSQIYDKQLPLSSSEPFVYQPTKLPSSQKIQPVLQTEKEEFSTKSGKMGREPEDISASEVSPTH